MGVCSISLHCKCVESAVNHCYGACDERGCIADEILDCAAEFFGTAETLERSLAYNVLAAFGERTIGVGEECPVLVGEEESGGYGVDADV